MNDLAETLARNVSAVEERIHAACARTGRKREEITLLAVTKVVPCEVVYESYFHGLREFGENYVQEFETKANRLRQLSDARFHLIGHLQANKSSRAASIFDVIQTVHSEKLARRLDETGKPLETMIEVKLSAEEAKSGCAPEDLPALVDAVRRCPHLTLTGLMTMPPWSDDPEQSRPYFARLRELAAAHGLRKLSMGMSHDLEAAIEEGATIVRVGTAIYGPRRRN